MADVEPTVSLGSRIELDRTSIDGFITRHLLLWDLCMAVLALIYVGLGLFEDHPVWGVRSATLVPLEYVITAIFFAEFCLRLYVAPSRRRYLEQHWLDLVALIPVIRWLRIARLARFARLIEVARLARLGVLARCLVEIERVLKEMRSVAARHGVNVFLAISASLVVIGGTLVWELEHTINPEFHNFGDAMWWAFATVTTIGYGDGPVTVAGRIIAAFIMVLGVACFGAVTATVTAYFMQQPATSYPAASRAEASALPAEPTPADLMAMLEDIRGRLERIEREQTGQERRDVAPRAVASRAGAPAPVSARQRRRFDR